ncbi:MAG: UDP-N-acetylglucosamine 2-epimerase (hydrolyzing), partial [Bacteroidetes bacterium]
MKKRKICVITGSRAEYGQLFWILKEIQEDTELELQLVVTGMHLSPEFGQTSEIITYDGFPITRKVEVLLSSDTAVGISKSMGLAMISFSEVFEAI